MTEIATLSVLIDWTGTKTYVDVTAKVDSITWERGANADLSGSAVGQATIVLLNHDGSLDPGADTWDAGLVRIRGTYSTVVYPQFTGRIDRWSWDPVGRTVTLSVSDVLASLAGTNVYIPPPTDAQSTSTYRDLVLDAFLAANYNPTANPSFATNTTGWSKTHVGYGNVDATSITRSTSDWASASCAADTACGVAVFPAGTNYGEVNWLVAGKYYAGEMFTASVYLKSAGATTDCYLYLGDTLSDYEDVLVTVTSSWQRFSVSYAPVATGTVLRLALTHYDAATIRIDAAQIVPGYGVWPYTTGSAELFGTSAWWTIDGAYPDNQASGMNDQKAEKIASAGSLLTALNGATGTRHWVGAKATAPYFQYYTQGRETIPASAETIDDDVTGSTGWDCDRGMGVNSATVGYGWWYATKSAADTTSIVTHGLREASTTGSFWIDATDAQAYADWMVANLVVGRLRPTLTVTNRFPSQLQRDVGDTVTLNFARLGISAVTFRIAKVSTTVTEGGRRWETRWLVEEI